MNLNWQRKVMFIIIIIVYNSFPLCRIPVLCVMKLKKSWNPSDTEWDSVLVSHLSHCLSDISLWPVCLTCLSDLLVRPVSLNFPSDLSLKGVPLTCLSLPAQFVLQLVDISLPENKEWLDRYRWDIPVFHLNGQFVMKHRVDVVLLDRLLKDTETNTEDPTNSNK